MLTTKHFSRSLSKVWMFCFCTKCNNRNEIPCKLRWKNILKHQNKSFFVYMLVEVLRDMEFIRFQSNLERFKLQLPVCDSWAVYAGRETRNLCELCEYERSEGTVSRDFLLLVYVMNQFPPSPWLYHEARLEFFRKFADIFAAQGAPPVSLTPVANGNNLQSENFHNFFWTPLDGRVRI